MTTFRKGILFLGTPAVGIIALIIATAIDHYVRYLRGMHTYGINSAGYVEGGSPFLWMIYSIFCWVFILPTVAILRFRCSGFFGNPIVIGLIVAGLPSAILSIAFHIPEIDKWWETPLLVGFVFGIPIFASAVVAAISTEPNKAAMGKPDPVVS